MTSLPKEFQTLIDKQIQQMVDSTVNSANDIYDLCLHNLEYFSPATLELIAPFTNPAHVEDFEDPYAHNKAWQQVLTRMKAEYDKYLPPNLH